MAERLGVIGCGKMAYALLKGLDLSSYQSVSCYDVNPERTRLFDAEFQAVSLRTSQLVRESDIVLLAVKPQQIQSVLRDAAGSWKPDQLLISILAGVKTATLEEGTGVEMPVIRVMPNTPCLVGQGVSALCRGRFATPDHGKTAAGIFTQVGIAEEVEEKLMDAVTAVSGSGPAYAFLVVEAMQNAAVQVGLDAAMARKLVIGTIQGSLAMLEGTGSHPAVLREQVCSPAGTTIAGVRALESNGLRKAFFDAIENAYHRSIELGKQ